MIEEWIADQCDVTVPRLLNDFCQNIGTIDLHIGTIDLPTEKGSLTGGYYDTEQDQLPIQFNSVGDVIGSLPQAEAPYPTSGGAGGVAAVCSRLWGEPQSVPFASARTRLSV